MARTPRKLIDGLVALLILTLAVVGFARPAQAYPPGQSLTVNVKSFTNGENGNRVEFIVRHAKPGTSVRMNFEDEQKSKNAGSNGIAVFSFVAPTSGVHIAAAYNRAERASTTLYVADASLLRARSAAGSSNYVTVSGVRAGAVVSAKIGDKSYSGIVGSNNRVVLTVKVPAKGAYSVRVFVGTKLLETLNGRSL